MLGAVFERFVEKSPISVMVRGTLERVLGPDPLDWWYERTAKKQYTRELLFSTVYDLMSQVVFRLQHGHSVFEFNTDESQCLCWLGCEPAASRRYIGFACPP